MLHDGSILFDTLLSLDRWTQLMQRRLLLAQSDILGKDFATVIATESLLSITTMQVSPRPLTFYRGVEGTESLNGYSSTDYRPFVSC